MPRKSDGIPFILSPRPTKSADGKQQFYARLDPGRKLDIEFVDNECARISSLHNGDFRRTCEIFMDAVAHLIANGYRIETPIGSFAPKLRTLGEHTDADNFSNGSVMYAGIDFKPSKQLKNRVLSHQKGCYKINAHAGNMQMHDTKLMYKALSESMTDGIITVRSFCLNSKLKYASARQYLDHLCHGDFPLLKCSKIGRSLIYMPTERYAGIINR